MTLTHDGREYFLRFNVGYRGPAGRVPKWELFAPLGYTFAGPHSVMVWTIDEARVEVRGLPLEPCATEGCDCREGWGEGAA